MSAITPSTNLKLLKNPNNLSSQNQLTFADATAQYNYFNGLTKLEVEDFTYQRKDYVIRYSACIDDILDYNYCMYQNEEYTNKWFYAYIVNMRYVNDNLTEITIRTDVFQTYQFDLTYKSCYVEREHVNDDTVGLHTIDEGLGTGDYICNSLDTYLFNNIRFVIQVGGSKDNPVPNKATNVNGIIQPGSFYVCADYSDFVNAIQTVDNQIGWEVINAYMIPADFLDYNLSGYWTGKDSPVTKTKTVTKQSTLDGYTPVNHKCLVYPFQYLLETNNNGGSNILKYEMFTTSDMTFNIKGVSTLGGSIVSIPTNYKEGNEVNMLVAGKFPTLAWSTDSYTNWLTQNGVNIPGHEMNAVQFNNTMAGLKIGAGVVAGLAGGIVTGGSLISSGFSDVLGTIASNYQAKQVPDTYHGNTNSGDYITASNTNGFYFYKMSVRSEIARSIDSYFSMYGYKVNSVKVPNITGRLNWNFVKCVGANIEALIPEDYLNEIKNMFNSGITLWHNSSTFLDYSQSNAIVTP